MDKKRPLRRPLASLECRQDKAPAALHSRHRRHQCACRRVNTDVYRPPSARHSNSIHTDRRRTPRHHRPRQTHSMDKFHDGMVRPLAERRQLLVGGNIQAEETINKQSTPLSSTIGSHSLTTAGHDSRLCVYKAIYLLQNGELQQKRHTMKNIA